MGTDAKDVLGDRLAMDKPVNPRAVPTHASVEVSVGKIILLKTDFITCN